MNGSEHIYLCQLGHIDYNASSNSLDLISSIGLLSQSAPELRVNFNCEKLLIDCQVARSVFASCIRFS